MAALFGIGGSEILILLFLVVVIVTILAIVDIVKSEFPGNGKIIWLLVVLFAGLIGSIIYFVIGRAQKIPKGQKRTENGGDPFGG